MTPHRIILKETTEPSVDPGTYLARCFRVVDAGTQPDGPYGEKHKLIITWELPHERITVEGRDLPRSISAFYNLSLGKKSNLRRDLEAWRGRPFTPEELQGFELGKVLGTACQLTVVHSEISGKANVKSVAGIPRGTIVPEVFNPKVEYSYEQGQDSVYKTLPEWLQKMVNNCVEWTKPADPVDPPADHVEEPMDDVPF